MHPDIREILFTREQIAARVAAELGVEFLDAAAYADPSAVDGIHMEASGHAALGEAVARKVREIFAGE